MIRYAVHLLALPLTVAIVAASTLEHDVQCTQADVGERVEGLALRHS